MTTNDIMLRDIMEADKKEREREAAAEQKRQARRPGEALVKWATVAGGILAVATILFLAWCIISDTPHRRGFFGGNESTTTERECAPVE